jgi:Ni,Fe-hydrogenase maturation factor
LEKLEPGNEIPALDHALDPPALLQLAGELFGRTPPAWILAIPATDMEFGDTLSPAVQAAIDLALNQIRTHFSRFQEMPS